MYRDADLSLSDIISRAEGDIDTIKAIVNINIEKDNRPYSYIDASLLLKKPNWIQMRWYRFGLPAGNLLIKDNVVHAVSGKGARKFTKVGNELFYAVFWWEDLDNARMVKEGKEYVIRTDNKEIRLGIATLLPNSQDIRVNGKEIHILYAKPVQENDYWYLSEIVVEIGNYLFTITIDKLIVNPVPGESDFT
jgi:hypothetical protein